jgi:hypothetical protein
MALKQADPLALIEGHRLADKLSKLAVICSQIGYDAASHSKEADELR